jgi:hypothetical protein
MRGHDAIQIIGDSMPQIRVRSGILVADGIGNPYLDAYMVSMARVNVTEEWTRERMLFESEQTRMRNARRTCFAYAIPNDVAIRRLVSAGPLLEVGAGLGYWARLIRDGGGDILAVDRDWSAGSDKPGFNPENRFHGEGNEAWTQVVLVDDCVATVRDHPERTLFLCWPPWGNPDAPEPADGWFDAECLKAFSGDVFILVGEIGGCTGSPAFERELRARWETRRCRDRHRWSTASSCPLSLEGGAPVLACVVMGGIDLHLGPVLDENL